MKTMKKLVGAALLLGLFCSPAMASEETEKGKALAFDRKKGNCLTCHYIQGGTLMGNSGPALVAMKQRFPDRANLVAQVADPHAKNPRSIMPPFDKHEILSKSEIDLIVTWLYTL